MADAGLTCSRWSLSVRAGSPVGMQDYPMQTHSRSEDCETHK